MRDLILGLRPESEAGLQTQLRSKLAAAIVNGQLASGQRLPSSRELARTLGISRNTVSLAYQRLIDDGLIVARDRSGYFVETNVSYDATLSQPADATEQLTWDDRFRVRPSEQINIARPTDWTRYAYPFVFGQVQDRLFPIADWRDCARRALGRQWLEGWLADHLTADDPMLVEQIRTRLLPRRGVMLDEDQILVTMGAQQALYLLASLLVKPTSVVGLENPGYPDVRNIFALHTRGLRPLPVDDEGLMIGPHLTGCDIIYTTPSHQAPTTATMSKGRRLALLDAAAANNTILIEDDYEFETNYVGAPTPSLKSLDRDGRVIYVGSLSKMLFPGLRLGFLAGDAELVREARALRRLMVRHPPTIDQRTTAHFLALGHHDGMMLRLRRTYRERWHEIKSAVGDLLPECRVMPSHGGSSIWIEGPDDLDTEDLATRALKADVVIEPGHVYYFQHAPPKNHFRLGFSSIDTDAIRPGISRLAGLL